MSQSLWSQGGAARPAVSKDEILSQSQSLWSQGGAASETQLQSCPRQVSIPLKSGRCCKDLVYALVWSNQSQSLWSQGGAARNPWVRWSTKLRSLNPFEVREVLQGHIRRLTAIGSVSIPLKSGRCCKKNFMSIPLMWSLNPFEVREVLQEEWSSLWLRLKGLNPFEVREVLQDVAAAAELQGKKSQSLWSQGGAASTKKMVGCASGCLNPFEVREVLQEKEISLF